MNPTGQDARDRDGAAKRADAVWLVGPALVAVAVIANLRFGWHVGESQARSLDAVAYPLAAVPALGLTLCRDRPRLALAIVIVASLTYRFLDYPQHAGQFVGGVALFLAFVAGARWEAGLLSVVGGLTTAVALPGTLSDDTINDLARMQLFLIPTVPVLIGSLVWGYRRRIERLADQLLVARENHAISIERDSAKLYVSIARDLHDTVGHSIAVISVQSGAALSVLDSDPETAREALIAINDGCRKAMSETKRALAALRGGKDQRAPTLEATIMTARDAGLDVELQQSGTLEHVDPKVLDTLHRLAQESLTNTLKHADASNVDVHLDVDQKTVRFEFTDDGTSLHPITATSTPGVGLEGMTDRVTELGGQFEAGTTSAGFRVFAAIPISTIEQ